MLINAFIYERLHLAHYMVLMVGWNFIDYIQHLNDLESVSLLVTMGSTRL